MYNVRYTCRVCGEHFWHMHQADPTPDDDADMCRECLDVVIYDETHGTFDDPWTTELIRQARGIKLRFSASVA